MFIIRMFQYLRGKRYIEVKESKRGDWRWFAYHKRRDGRQLAHQGLRPTPTCARTRRKPSLADGGRLL